MTPAEWDALQRYLRRLADLLALKDWRIDLKRDGWCGEDSMAHIRCVEGRKWATVTIASDFRGEAPDLQRTCMVHELTHCHLAHAQHLVEVDLKEALGGPAHTTFLVAYRRAKEYGVDAIADAIAPLVPLIEWPGEDTEAETPAQEADHA